MATTMSMTVTPQGDKLELESEGEPMVLRPVRSASAIGKKRGVWVFQGDTRLSAAATDKVLRDIREQRDRENREPKG